MVHVASVIVAETLIGAFGLEGSTAITVIAAAFVGIYAASAILYAFVERPAQHPFLRILLCIGGPPHDRSFVESA